MACRLFDTAIWFLFRQNASQNAFCKMVDLLLRPQCLRDMWLHRPYSSQVTERLGCNVVIHPPPSIYPKAGNGALRDQWAIKYNCQNDSSTIAFTVRDLVHWNYVISQNIPRVCKSWKSLSIYVFAAYIFLFTRHSVHWSKLPVKLRSGHRQWLSSNYRG